MTVRRFLRFSNLAEPGPSADVANPISQRKVPREILGLAEHGMAGSLDGIRVIDFGQYIAGPLAAVMLGDQGSCYGHTGPWSGGWERQGQAVTGIIESGRRAG